MRHVLICCYSEFHVGHDLQTDRSCKLATLSNSILKLYNFEHIYHYIKLCRTALSTVVSVR